MTNQIMITFQQILDKEPCVDGWAKLLLAKGVIDEEIHDSWVDDDQYDMDGISLPEDPFPISDALGTNGLNGTIWALQCIEDQNLVRKFAVWCAYQVEHLMTDQRSKDALRVAWAYSEGNATEEELTDARDAARAAVLDAARDARDAVLAAAMGARAAVLDAAMGARDTARDAVLAAVLDAVLDARDTARAAATAAQKIKLKEILDTGEFPCPWEG